jgi:hypothetical protein
MASILIIETVPRAKNPIDAHVRNALAFKTELEARGHTVDLLFIQENSKRYQKKYDIIFVSYATQYPLIHEVENIEKMNEDTPWGWITNEYNLRPNAFAYTIFKRRRSFLLCNYEIVSVKFACFDAEYSVNLNPLLFKNLPVGKKTHDFIYYGTYRPDREVYFKKYFTEQVYLSTSTKNHKKFLHIKCKSKPIAKFGWNNPALQAFRYSIYIEDTFTHNHFNNLANRYYESLACRCVLLFDVSCEGTLKKAGITNYKPFLINSADDFVKYNADNYEELLAIQSKWRDKVVAERNQIITEIENVINTELSILSKSAETIT